MVCKQRDNIFFSAFAVCTMPGKSRFPFYAPPMRQNASSLRVGWEAIGSNQNVMPLIKQAAPGTKDK